MPDPSHRSYSDLLAGFREHRKEIGLPPCGNHEFRVPPLDRDGRPAKPRKDHAPEELPEKEAGK